MAVIYGNAFNLLHSDDMLGVLTTRWGDSNEYTQFTTS